MIFRGLRIDPERMTHEITQNATAF